jgi:hypothetical protein
MYDLRTANFIISISQLFHVNILNHKNEFAQKKRM